MTRLSSVRIRIAMLAAVVSAGMPAAPTAGQEPGARRTGAAVISPEVAADRRVTFRLPAPDAKAVTVSGDFGPDTEHAQGRGRRVERDHRPARCGDVRLLLHRRRRSAHRSEQPTGEDRLRHHDDDQPADGPRSAARLLRRPGRAAWGDSNAPLPVQVEWRHPRTERLRAAGLRPGAQPALPRALPAPRLRQRSPLVAPLRARQRHPRQPAGEGVASHRSSS